jgi:hypothetical protein
MKFNRNEICMVEQLEEVSCVSPDNAEWLVYLQFFKLISSGGFNEWISVALASYVHVYVLVCELS